MLPRCLDNPGLQPELVHISGRSGGGDGDRTCCNKASALQFSTDELQDEAYGPARGSEKLCFDSTAALSSSIPVLEPVGIVLVDQLRQTAGKRKETT